MIAPVPTVAALSEYALADLGPPGAISLAQNESAFPPSPAALKAGAAALGSGALYPDPDWRDLRTAIAGVHSASPEGVLCGAGSMELIGALIRAFAGPGDQVLGTQYGYLFVQTAALQSGADYVAAPEPDLHVDIPAILDRVTPRTRIVFVCNPGNPTGTRVANQDLVALRAALPDTILLVIDQAYAEFDPQDHTPIFALVQDGNTVVTRTLSKAYGLAGARVGWGAFPPQIAAQVRKLLNPNNIALTSQAMAAAAMTDQAYMQRTVAQTGAIRDACAARLRAAGYDVPQSATNFVLVRCASAEAASRAKSALNSANIIPRPMNGYGLTDALRLTIGPQNVMDHAAQILENLR